MAIPLAENLGDLRYFCQDRGVQGYYDAIGADYAKHRRINADVLRQLVGKSGLKPTSRILEIGCGTGHYLNAIRQLLPCEVWGIDPAEKMLDLARKLCPVARFSVASAEDPNLPHDWFDLAFAVDVVHHLQDRPASFRQAHAALKPGGKICLVTDSPGIIRAREPQSVYFPESVDPELARYPTPETLIKELTKAGFENIETSEAEVRTILHSVEPYRAKVFSALKLIPEDAFQRGLEKLEKAFKSGEIPYISRNIMVWAEKPGGAGNEVAHETH